MQIESSRNSLLGGRLSGGLGRCPKDLQGTRPLTRIAGSARTRPRRRAGRQAEPPSWAIGYTA